MVFPRANDVIGRPPTIVQGSGNPHLLPVGPGDAADTALFLAALEETQIMNHVTNVIIDPLDLDRPELVILNPAYSDPSREEIVPAEPAHAQGTAEAVLRAAQEEAQFMNHVTDVTPTFDDPLHAYRPELLPLSRSSWEFVMEEIVPAEPGHFQGTAEDRGQQARGGPSRARSRSPCPLRHSSVGNVRVTSGGLPLRRSFPYRPHNETASRHRDGNTKVMDGVKDVPQTDELYPEDHVDRRGPSRLMTFPLSTGDLPRHMFA